MSLDFKPGQFKIIRVDGTEQIISQRPTIRAICQFLGCDSIDTVNVTRAFQGNRKAVIMAVDDTGMIDGKPVNAKGTALYHAICRPGVTHPICGDVALAYDKDFA